MQCDFESVIRFDGIIVYDEEGVRWWMGVNETGLNSFIDSYLNSDKIDVRTFKIYKNREFIETVGEYIKRTREEGRNGGDQV